MDIRTMVSRGFNVWSQKKEIIVTVPICGPDMKTTGIDSMKVRVKVSNPLIPTVKVVR